MRQAIRGQQTTLQLREIYVQTFYPILHQSRAKVVYEYLYRQISDKKVRETIDFLLNREEAHNAMFREAFNKVQNTGSNRDFGTTKAARMYFSMSEPSPSENRFAKTDVKPPSFQ